MASQFQSKADLHWDSTCGTVHDEVGEIGGIMSITYGSGSRSRGRVVTVGSRYPVGYTPGGVTPSDARIVMYRKDAVAWIKQLKDRHAPTKVCDVRIDFRIKLAPLDEEGSSLPAEVDSFTALINPPEGLGFDRGREADAIQVEIPLFIVSKVLIDGVEMD